MKTTEQFKKQLPKNAITAVLQFVVSCVVAVWLTPYLVKHLGVAAYGLVPLAALLTQYVAIITAQLSLAVRRFLVIEMKKENGDPKVVFNSAVILYLILIVIQAPLFIVAILNITSIFSIPTELLSDAQILFSCSAASFLITLMTGVFGVSIYANNRLDITATINLARNITRLILIVVVFTIFGPKLRYIGLIELFLTIFVGVCNLYYWRKLTPELTLNLLRIDLRILLPIFKMSSWTLVNNLGAMLYMRTDLWIINKFISPIAAGQYATILVVVEFIRRLGTLVSDQSGPVILNYFAKEEWSELKKLLQMWTKMTAIIIAVPVGIIFANASELLEVWLGKDFVGLAPVLCLTTIHLFINVGVGSQSNLQMAANRVKLPGLVTFMTGVINVMVTYSLGVVLDFGIIGVALGGAVVMTLRNVLFSYVYGAKILNLRNTTFVTPLISGVLVFVISAIIGSIPFSRWVGFSVGYASLAITSMVSAILTMLFIWYVILAKQERQLLIGVVPYRFQKYIKILIKS